MDALVKDALEFAKWAHGSIDHRRKYTGEPYIAHPVEVMQLVSTVAHTPEMLAAALLHDTVEDVPDVTIETVYERFGPVVGRYVQGLTDTSSKEDGSREQRKAVDRMRLYRECAEVQTIKLGDLLSNTPSIVKHDPNFGRVYVHEKSLLLCVLTKGDPLLLGKAFAMLIDAADQLRIDIFDRSTFRIRPA